MNPKVKPIFALGIYLVLLGGFVFNWLDGGYGIPNLNSIEVVMFVLASTPFGKPSYVFASATLSTVYNDLLWGLWYGVPMTAYINPFADFYSGTITIFGMAFRMTPAFLFDTIIIRVFAHEAEA